ncbi:MAG: hypothetical protein AAGI22_05800 [Planctomycetota bacterium]
MLLPLAIPLAASLTGAPAAPLSPPCPGPTLSFESGQPVDDVADAIEAAGDDAAKLAALADAWSEEERERDAVRAWERVLEVDGDHEGARRGLRHHRYDGQWYETYAALAKVRRAEAKRRFETDGTVRFGDLWVLADELPYHRMGWEKLDDGTFAPPGTRERLADDAAKAAAGWEKQHTTWIDPQDFGKWRQGLWKVGDEWLETAAANEAHSKIGAWWQVPGEHFVALTTVPEDKGRWVVWWADAAHADLARIFGLAAPSKPEFVVLDSIAQYNQFSAGDPAAGFGPADANGYSSVHYAFFTDGWMDASSAVPAFKGTGAAYYDANDPALEPFGQHAVRHAAALAWLEAVDPSWTAVSQMLTSPGGGFPDRPFWDEKRIPRWLRYGAAAYCERFFEDANVGEGGDPLWARKWALQNLKSGGTLDPIEDVLALQIDTNEPEASCRLIHEAGLLVHFLVDGEDKKVGKAWTAYREALVAGDDVGEHVAVLEEALVKAQKKIAAFGGL